MSNAVSIALFTIFVLESILIIIGNTFTIFVFWTKRLKLKRTVFLLINLTVADLLVGVSQSIILGIEKIPEENAVRKGKTLSRNPSSAFIIFGSSTSVIFLALISLERVYAVLWPFRHRATNTRVYIYSIVFVWAFGFCTTGLSVLSLYYTTVEGVYVAVTIHSCLCVALFVICTSYLKIRTRLRCSVPGLEVHKGSRQSRETVLRLSRTFFIVTALSLVFWLPAFIVYTTGEFCTTCFSPLILEIVNVLRLANSMVNPFIYSFRMPIFKDALKGCQKKQRQDFELRPVAMNMQ